MDAGTGNITNRVTASLGYQSELKASSHITDINCLYRPLVMTSLNRTLVIFVALQDI